MAAEGNVPRLVDKKGGSYYSIAPKPELGKFNKCKKRMLCCVTAPRRSDAYVLDMSSLTPNGSCFFAKALESKTTIEETYHVTFDESMEAIRLTNALVDEIGIDDSSRYPPDEFLQEDDPSRQYQSNFNFSYYIIPRVRSLTELIKDTHVLEVITLNEQNTPYTEDIKGPPDLIKIKGTEEQEVQNELINSQPTEETSRNNTKTSIPISEPSFPEVPQSQIIHHASTSSHPAPQDIWSRDQHIKLVNIIGEPTEDMLTRSMAAKMTAASASECLFADFLSEIEPKKVFEVLKHLGWVDGIQEELNQFYRNKVWTLVPLPYRKIAIGSKWVFMNKKDELGTVIKNKARLVA
ncbi:hypothetical protein Tco_0382880 [Tanacetum coccineum]